MAFIINAAWVANQAYSAGATVNFNGVDYEALNAVNSATNPSQDGVNWKVVAVTKIQDYNSLVEAIRLQLNVRSNDDINNSIPLFIQLIEESFKTRIRAPQQRKTVILDVDSSSRVEAPADLLEVISMRFNSMRSTQYSIFRNDIVEILNANKEEYERALRANFGEYYDYNGSSFESAVYWFDNRYFNLAPTYAQGDEIELVYYAAEPQLGSTLFLTDSDGNPIDSAGMRTSVSGNPQATQVVTQNWFTAAAPQMLLYGSLMKAAQYLQRNEDVDRYTALYEIAEGEIQRMIDTFEESQPHTLFIQNTYSSNI